MYSQYCASYSRSTRRALHSAWQTLVPCSRRPNADSMCTWHGPSFASPFFLSHCRFTISVKGDDDALSPLQPRARSGRPCPRPSHFPASLQRSTSSYIAAQGTSLALVCLTPCVHVLIDCISGAAVLTATCGRGHSGCTKPTAQRAGL